MIRAPRRRASWKARQVVTGADMDRQLPQMTKQLLRARSGSGMSPHRALSMASDGQKQMGFAPVMLGEPRRLKKRA